MFPTSLRFAVVFLPLWLVVPHSPRVLGEDDAAFFENRVRPILVDRCLKCHGAEKAEGSLRLDSANALEQGGDSGDLLVPGDPGHSLLISAIRYEDYEMPPSGKLPDNEIAVLTEWVGRGAVFPSSAESGMQLRASATITAEDREYWAFAPLKETQPPQVDHPLAKTTIDRFVLDKLQQQDMTYTSAADKRTLARRLYLSLLGVPPSIKELHQFLDDQSDDAYASLVERLLADERYGQKWARHWLDLVRYAESDGFNQDASRPTAYLYRDWVIQALNDDMPYDEFVAYQLAGDQLEPDNAEALAATGYLRHWIYEYNQRDVENQWSNILNDLTDVTGEVFFGLGIGCARCHDHKFDPLLQKDYYRLQATFASFLPVDDLLYADGEALNAYQRDLKKWEEATQDIRDQIAALEKTERDKTKAISLGRFPPSIQPIIAKSAKDRDGYEQQLYDLVYRQVLDDWGKIDFKKKLKGEEKERWEQLQQELKEFDSLKPAKPPRIPAVSNIVGSAPAVRIPKTEIEVQHSSFEVQGASKLDGETENRRVALAQWINAEDNPLPHRVFVNRVWQGHFGTGIVANANDFGRLGVPPTHPELLDWLALEFRRNKLSIKQLHRLIVSTEAFKQGCAESPSQEDLSLLASYPIRRLDAEQIRDSVLAVSNSMKPKSRGPSSSHDSLVRSIFTTVKRNRPHAFLTAFDAPDATTSVGRRSVTTTPNQSLLLSNSPWLLARSADMAKDLLLNQNTTQAEQVRSAFERCYQRLPTDSELQACLQFLEHQASIHQAKKEPKPDEKGKDSSKEKPNDSDRATSATAALADLCHVLMNSSEFIYID